MKHVGADCGDTYAKAMASAAPLFSVDIPSGCEAQVGGVSNLQASALTMIGAGALILLGRHWKSNFHKKLKDLANLLEY